MLAERGGLRVLKSGAMMLKLKLRKRDEKDDRSADLKDNVSS